jgi:hypothetical protein
MVKNDLSFYFVVKIVGWWNPAVCSIKRDEEAELLKSEWSVKLQLHIKFTDP